MTAIAAALALFAAAHVAPAAATPAAAPTAPISRDHCAAYQRELGGLVRRASLAASPELRASIRAFIGADGRCGGARSFVVLSGADYVALTRRLERIEAAIGSPARPVSLAYGLRIVDRAGSLIDRVEQTEAYRFPQPHETRTAGGER